MHFLGFQGGGCASGGDAGGRKKNGALASSGYQASCCGGFGGGCAFGVNAGGFGAAVGIKLRLIAALWQAPATRRAALA
ncbi:MAG: hypothetical protein WBI94_00315, partial [Candidatus Cloacimonadaceae bacterium]